MEGLISDQIPQNWMLLKLKEVATLSGRIGWKGLTAKEYTESGPLFLSVHSLNYGDYVDFRDAFHISQYRYDESPEIILQSADVLICKDGAGIGKVGIIGELLQPTTINSSLLLIRSGVSVLPKFLYYVLLSPYFQSIVQSRLEGATTPHLYQRDIKEFPVPIPPLSEQKRIVAILEEAFAGINQAIANSEKNLANARELFESYLNNVFTQNVEAWKQAILSDICDVRDGTHESPKYISNGIPFVTQKHIRETGLTFENTKYILEQDHQNFYKRSNVCKGDILISMIGANRGMACLVDDSRVFSIKNVGLIKANDNVDMRFLLNYLKSDMAKRYIEAESRGGAQSFIGLGKLRDFPVIVAPINVQKTVVEKLDRLQTETKRLETIYKQKSTAFGELKQSILQKAFTGELTTDVAQQPAANA